jgi:hypothetical protein
VSERNLARLLAALIVIALTIAVVVGQDLLTDDAPRPVPPRAPAAPAAKAPTGELQTKDPGQLRDDTPSDIPKPVLQRAEEAEHKEADPLPPVDAPLPVAGAQGYSCRTDYAHRGYGQRAAGSKVMSFKLHFTVSPNIPGWADVDGVGDYLERVGLSAHDIIDFEGHCEHRVPYSLNAYTEGSFNSTSESVEIIATGRETRAQWLAAPLFKRRILANYVRDRLRARGLPLRFVDPQGCVDQLGYTDHNHLECGNDHSDVAPTCAAGHLPQYPLSPPLGCSGFPFDVFQRQVADGPRPVTLTDRITCRKLRWWREHGRPHGKPERNAVRRRRALTARAITCTARGPVRR